MRRISVYGATGSIGESPLDLAARRPVFPRSDGRGEAALNAAKEVALDQFIADAVGFGAMAAAVEEALFQLSSDARLTIAPTNLDTVSKMDHLARVRASDVAATMARAAQR